MVSKQKTYTVTVTVEASCQLEVKASSTKEAKEKARKLAGELIEIVFDGECISPDSEVLPIGDDAVEEE